MNTICIGYIPIYKVYRYKHLVIKTSTYFYTLVGEYSYPSRYTLYWRDGQFVKRK